MSKFFGGGFSSGSSEESSSDESEEEINETKKASKAKEKPTKKNESSSEEESSSEDEKPVAKAPVKNTEKDELRKTLKEATSKIEENLKTKNIDGLNQDFLNVSEVLTKNEKLIAKVGDFNFLLKLLMKMDDFISSAKGEEKDLIAKWGLKHKFKQFLKPKYKNKLEAYKKNPKDSEDEEKKEEAPKSKKKSKKDKKKKKSSEEDSDEEEESEDESDEDDKKKTKKKKADDDDSDIDWSKEDSSSSSEESDEEKVEEQQDKPLSLEERRKKWLKKPEDMQKKKKEKVIKPKDESQTDKKLEEIIAKEKEVKETKLGKERFLNIDFTNDYVAEQHLKKIKKTTDKDVFEDNFEPALLKMHKQVTNKVIRVEVLYKLVTGVFAIIKGHVDCYMIRDQWNFVIGYINELLDLIEDNVKVDEDRMNRLNFYKFIEAAHSELYTAFQRLQPQNIEYVKRLYDEHKMILLIERVLKYYLSKHDEHNVAKTSLLLLSHIYYKHDSVYVKMQKLAESKPENERRNYYILGRGESEAKINQLVKYVFEEGYTRSYWVQATLYQIYHHAIHNRFYKAREQLLSSQLAKLITKQDENVQILYNRTTVQIGLSAFRIGLVEECFDISKDIANYGRLKELLAQSIKSNSTEKQMRTEKKRFIPAHLQIDCELVDFIHMIWAMLLEIPNISRNEYNIESNIISKPYRKLIDSADQTLFNGPPEQSREFVIYASRSLYHGDWRQAVEYVFGATKMWKLIPNLEEVKNTLTTKIKEAAFKVLMFRSSKSYENFSISDLGALFELSENDIKILAGKIILRDGLRMRININNNWNGSSKESK